MPQCFCIHCGAGQDQIRTFTGLSFKSKQTWELSLQEASYPWILAHGGAGREQHMLHVVRVVDDGNGGGNGIRIAHQWQHVEVHGIHTR